MLLYLLSYTFIGFRVWTARSLSMIIFMIIVIKTVHSGVLQTGQKIKETYGRKQTGQADEACRQEFRASVCRGRSNISRKQRWRLWLIKGGLHLHTPTAPVCKKINDVEDATWTLLTYCEKSRKQTVWVQSAEQHEEISSDLENVPVLQGMWDLPPKGARASSQIGLFLMVCDGWQTTVSTSMWYCERYQVITLPDSFHFIEKCQNSRHWRG